MISNFLSQFEIEEMGFLAVGDNVLISRKASFYCTEKISIGNNVRIDDFCIISGLVTFGDYIHIAAYTALYGSDKGIIILDFANISSRVTIYSISDDYSGETMTNPLIPVKYKKLHAAPVIIEKHVIIGAGCVILPGVIIKEGSSFGAMTLINRDSESWSINVGIPFKKIKERSKNLLLLEKEFIKDHIK